MGDRAARADRWHEGLRVVARGLARVLTPVDLVSPEQLPATGPAIVAANHVSFFDTVAIAVAVPRRTYFVGKAEYLDSFATRHLFPALGLIPIDRADARRAMAALEVAAGVLREGRVLGIYPEGTRSRDGKLHAGRTGVAQLAIMTGAPIVPVGIVGTDRVQPVGARVPRPFRRSQLRFGAPIDPADYGGSPRRRRQLITSDLMEAIRLLSGRPLSDDAAVDEPPLFRGGNESVYQVHHVARKAVSWQQAAQFAVSGVCERHDDARVGEVRELSCVVEPDGVVRFRAEMGVSVKFRPQRTAEREEIA